MRPTDEHGPLPITADAHDYQSWTMFVAAHRARSPRRRSRGTGDHAVILAPDPSVRRWIEHELFGERVTTQFVDTLVDVVTTLTLVPPPWPQLLIIDTAALSPTDAKLLGTIRAAGWSGMAIAIGKVPKVMRRSLGIDRVLSRALGSEELRTAIQRAGVERPTIPMRRIAR